jgi:hypothetical protein
MRYLWFVSALSMLLWGCSPSKKLNSYYSVEDKTVFELLDRIEKNPADKEALGLFPGAYETAVKKRRELNEISYTTLPPGDRYVQLLKEYTVMQQLYQRIGQIPAAAKTVQEVWNPEADMQRAKNNGAREYYNHGLEYLTYDNRSAARSAYDCFRKANELVPGYQDVRNKMQEAQERSTLKVIVRTANYFNQGWGYWGLQNDWLQQQLIIDLNNRSLNDIRFYSDWEAANRRIRADQYVELNFTELFAGQVFNDQRTIRRSKQIQTGTTKSNPPQPVYTTVYANVLINRRYMQSRATLECRIYENATGRNLLYDRFPGFDDWQVETATYSGDSRALTPADWQLINNNNMLMPPSREQIAEKLIRSCYQQLISRINSAVQFGSR